MSPAEQLEASAEAYFGHKRKWRRMSRKPTRRARRFSKRKGNFGGHRAHAYFNTPEVAAFFQRSGKRLKRNSTNKGLSAFFGGGKNPNGMKCSICNSDTHLRARCPRSNNRSGFHFVQPEQPSSSSSSMPGPLDGILNGIDNHYFTTLTAAHPHP